jgi:2-pyrone-4,6-dicarboxylate lactonase
LWRRGLTGSSGRSDWPPLSDGQRDTGELLNQLAGWAPTAGERRLILVDGPGRLFFDRT